MRRLIASLNNERDKMMSLAVGVVASILCSRDLASKPRKPLEDKWLSQPASLERVPRLS